MNLFDLAAAFKGWLGSLAGFFTDPRALFWWPTLATALLGAVLLFAANARGKPAVPGAERKSARDFLRELPMDIACYLGYTFTQVLMAKSLFWVTVGGITLVFLVAGQPAGPAVAPAFATQLTVAALAFVLADFCLYWSHRLFHWRPLWLLHRLHHNPAVLTPITAFRFWPPEAVVHFAAFNFGEGVALGIANLAFGANVTPVTYLGINIFLLSWFLAFSHLRHSHVALYYPRWLSHVLVSPHMHQAHHSVDPRHHQRNFGTALALWDWMFGTLHIPDRDERYRFGVVHG